MTKLYILLLMIFLHIVDDYYLQGILAKLKQRDWWRDNAPELMYEHDYIAALVAHGFSWAFMIMLPIAVILLNCGGNMGFFVFVFITNMLCHIIMDHFKANLKVCNLIIDQIFHLCQVVVTWLVLLKL